MNFINNSMLVKEIWIIFIKSFRLNMSFQPYWAIDFQSFSLLSLMLLFIKGNKCIRTIYAFLLRLINYLFNFYNVSFE